MDVGCGQCLHHPQLTGAGAKVVGLDFSRQNMASASSKRIQASADHLPFRDKTFDKPVCFSVLQYLDHDQGMDAIREFQRVTRRRILVGDIEIEKHPSASRLEHRLRYPFAKLRPTVYQSHDFPSGKFTQSENLRSRKDVTIEPPSSTHSSGFKNDD